ncbi:hypothetical protein Acidovoranil_06520 [Acidovorax sp. FG27]
MIASITRAIQLCTALAARKGAEDPVTPLRWDSRWRRLSATLSTASDPTNIPPDGISQAVADGGNDDNSCLLPPHGSQE